MRAPQDEDGLHTHTGLKSANWMPVASLVPPKHVALTAHCPARQTSLAIAAECSPRGSRKKHHVISKSDQAAANHPQYHAFMYYLLQDISQARCAGADADNRVSSSIWRAPSGSPRRPGPARLLHWIDIQHDTCHFSPVCPFGVGIEQTEIGSKILPVVNRSGHLPLAPGRRWADRAAAWAFSVLFAEPTNRVRLVQIVSVSCGSLHATVV
jgi:hypothetical protein